MPRSHGARRSSSSSSSRSTSSTTSTKSMDLQVPATKRVQAAIWFAGGDPRKHKNIRREVITTEYPNGRYKTRERYYLVRDPSGNTYYFAEDYDDTSSVYSEARSHRSSRRGSAPMPRPPAAAMPMPMPMPQPQPPPMQQGGPWMGHGGGGGGGPMPPPPMNGGGMHPGANMADGMYSDSDSSSDDGSSSYCTDDSGSLIDDGFDSIPFQMPPMANMQMPPMMQPMPPPPNPNMHMPPMMGSVPPMGQGGGATPAFYKLS